MQTKDRQLLNSNRCAFLAAGFAVAAWAPMIPFVKERFALDEHQLGLLLLCVGIGSFISLPITGALAGRFGCKKLIYAAVVLLAFLIVAVLAAGFGAITLFSNNSNRKKQAYFGLLKHCDSRLCNSYR